jgi:hypothetical protein
LPEAFDLGNLLHAIRVIAKKCERAVTKVSEFVLLGLDARFSFKAQALNFLVFYRQQLPMDKELLQVPCYRRAGFIVPFLGSSICA